MKGFAAFVLRGPATAAAVAAVTLLLGLVLPPLAWVSAAVLGLVTLCLGLQQALRVAIPALAGIGLAAWLVADQGVPVVVSGLATWAPVVLLGTVLRRRARLDDTLLTACGLGWVIVLVGHALVPEPGGWRELLTRLLPPKEVADQLAVGAAGLRELLDWIAPLMPGLIATSVVLSAATSLLLARWWQALLYHPGAFGREFRSLRLGRTAAVVAVGLCGGAMIMASPLFVGLALVAAAVYLLQGLAVVHGVVNVRGAGPGWLVAAYAAAVFLLPYSVGILVVLGAVDAWLDYRRRAASG